jgi:nickel/cobalt transporter (NicO) family protein
LRSSCGRARAPSWSKYLRWHKTYSRLVMGLGTAITVAAIATFAVGAKGLAFRVVRQRAGYGALAVRGLECVAAAAVLGFGVLLPMGYMARERMFGV